MEAKNIIFKNYVDFPKFAIGNIYDSDVLARAAGYFCGYAVASISCDIGEYHMVISYISSGEQRAGFNHDDEKAFKIASKFAKTNDRDELINFIENFERDFNGGNLTEACEFVFYKKFNEAQLVTFYDNSWYQAYIEVYKGDVELFSDYEDFFYLDADIFSSIEEIRPSATDGSDEAQQDYLLGLFNEASMYFKEQGN